MGRPMMPVPTKPIFVGLEAIGHPFVRYPDPGYDRHVIIDQVRQRGQARTEQRYAAAGCRRTRQPRF